MKDSLDYKALITMQRRQSLAKNAVKRGDSFEADHGYHYDGVGKRISHLKRHGLAETTGYDESDYMLYKVSEKGLCIKSMEDYARATYKPHTPKPKKTREESTVKKECKEIDIGSLIGPNAGYLRIEEKKPRYKRLLSVFIRK